MARARRARLLADAGIIRNRLKVDAAIENARRLQAIRARATAPSPPGSITITPSTRPIG